MSSSTQESDEKIGLEQASNPEDAPAASAVDDSISDHEQSASEDGAEAEETEPNVLGVSGSGRVSFGGPRSADFIIPWYRCLESGGDV